MDIHYGQQVSAEEKYVYQQVISGRRSIPAWIILLLGLYFSGLVSFRLYEQNQVNAESQFKSQVEKILKSIAKRLEDNELILQGAAALMEVEPNVTRKQWHEYVKALSLPERYPGIQGVGFSEIFPASQLAAHLESVRAEGFPQYSIKPEGRRQLYSSIKYIEPFEGRNLAAFGYDMYSNPIRRQAMKAAAEENKTKISAKVTLLQETHGKKQAGFLMYLPIYHANRPLNNSQQRFQAIKGFVYSPFRMDDLMAGIFNREEMLVDFHVFDGEKTTLETLMYDSEIGPNNRAFNEYTVNKQIQIYGHTWTIKVVAQPKFGQQFNSAEIWRVLALGVGISLSVFVMMLLIIGRRENATQLANKMISQYEHAKEHYIQQLTDVFSAASEIAMIATDRQGTITLFNSGAERLLGYRAEELVGKVTPAKFHLASEVEARSKELSVLYGEPVEGFDAFVAKPIREGAENREWHYINKKGEQIPVSLTVTVIRDDSGEITGFLGIAQNISERKRMDQMKSEFISTVSHELRTPLTSISGALGLVLGGRLGVLPEKAEKLLITAHRNSHRLAHLINDLLDVEKIAIGKLHFDLKILPIVSILEQAKEENLTYAAERFVNIELIHQVNDATVLVDEQRLKQVIANLVSNAIKYSPDGGSVTIESYIDNSNIVVSVSDEGPGIPDGFKDKIFSKFAQADSSDTRKKGGTGLGLAISRELIEHMNGSIGFESTEGKGARFFFKLPLAKVESTITLDKVSEPNQPVETSPRILVIEDDVDVAGLLKLMLEAAGYQVDICYAGLDALDMLKVRHYDLISLDLRLPDISGLEIIRRLRGDLYTAEIPIIVISGQVEQGLLELNSLTDNHIEWLAKPIDLRSLMRLVKHKLRLNQSLRVLHVEDDDDLHSVVTAMVSDDVVFDHAVSLERARSLLNQHPYQAVLLDILLPDGLGWDLIATIRTTQPDAVIIVLTGQDLNNQELDSVEAVIMKTRLTSEKLMDVIRNRIHP